MRHADLAADRWARSCFVMMPFGTREVGRRLVNFDRVYEDIFKPAIRRVQIDGKAMIPIRADEAAHSHLLHPEMFRNILRCRLALAEVSTSNGNVFYELGLRHSIVPSGTVLERLKGRPPAFDISPVLASEYSDRPPAAACRSIGTIAAAVRATLRVNAQDSPAYVAVREYVERMGPPERPTRFGEVIIAAEAKARTGATRDAAQLYSTAVELEPELALLHARHGALLLDSGEEKLAQKAFRRVLELQPRNREAHRVLDELRQGDRPTILPGRLPEVNDLVRRDGYLDLHRFRQAVRAFPGISVKILPGPARPRNYHSLIRVISRPEASVSSVVGVLRRHGAEPSAMALVVPEANRMIQMFDVASENRIARRSLVGQLQRQLGGLSGVGKVDVGGGKGGGFGRGGGPGGW